MKKCKFCAEEVQDDAIKCKHCGEDLSKQDKKMSKSEWITSGILILAGIIGVIVMLSVSSIDDNNYNKNKDDNDNGSVASVCAQNKIKTMLKSPSSAKFPWGLKSSLISGDKYRVANYVDSQNSFGAMIRTNYVCEVVVNNYKSFDCDVSCVVE